RVPTAIDMTAKPASMAVNTRAALAGEYPPAASSAPIRMLPNPYTSARRAWTAKIRRRSTGTNHTQAPRAGVSMVVDVSVDVRENRVHLRPARIHSHRGRRGNTGPRERTLGR